MRIALLRAVNVGGHRLLMTELRKLCADLGWLEVKSWLQSGNLIFQSSDPPFDLEGQLQEAVERRFGFRTFVMVRTAPAWSVLARSNPFTKAAEHSPNRLLLYVAKGPPLETADEVISGRASDGEQIARVKNAIWIHFPEGSSRSKLTPNFIDKAIGSPSTSRNHRTVLALEAQLLS